MTEAYPIGNGRIGGMVFGGLAHEHIQFNEISLWTGDEVNTGAYQALGDLFIDFPGKDTAAPIPSDYRRELDLSHAIQRITYTDKGVTYKREYYCSYPDQVMVLRFTADKKGAYSNIISLIDAHGTKTIQNDVLTSFTGTLENGMKYQASIMIVVDGGYARPEPDGNGNIRMNIKKADGFTIYLSAATDFSNKRAQHWKGEDPDQKNKRIFFAAISHHADLLTRHEEDYEHLFGRVTLELGHTPTVTTSLPTVQRLMNYNKEADHDLEALIFQYGRYLLISSSREGSLPANLQGLWNDSNNPPWRSDYHSNINIEMNYWPAECTNLSECAIPYLDYINSIREVKKESTQKEYPGVRGWTVRTENNSFGGSSYKWNTAGSAWYMQAIREHYAFTRDKTWLGSFGYPILKEVTEFWDDHLKRRPDGTLVSPMGWSPEHGPTEDGVTYDQEIIEDLFANYIEAADSLGIDKPYRDHVADMREHLLKPKIGKWGQLQEWETDRDDPDDHHRHVSHLFALYPGRQISITKTPELAAAAKVSLLARGDISTGWSMAWKMNYWARLQDGNHAYSLLEHFVHLVIATGVNMDNGGGIYSNLFCAHPPFQIDGNFGYTAGVTEMLVQSQTNEIQLLPALPDTWKDGHVKGLKARGNFEIADMQWKEGKITRLTIRSLSGGDCQIRVPHRDQPYNLQTRPGGVYTLIH